MVASLLHGPRSSVVFLFAKSKLGEPLHHEERYPSSSLANSIWRCLKGMRCIRRFRCVRAITGSSGEFRLAATVNGNRMSFPAIFLVNSSPDLRSFNNLPFQTFFVFCPLKSACQGRHARTPSSSLLRGLGAPSCVENSCVEILILRSSHPNRPRCGLIACPEPAPKRVSPRC
jgi:hypothetical protein